MVAQASTYNALATIVPGCGVSGSSYITSADSSPQLIQQVNFQLTSANIIGMNASPIILIPAPGANKSIVVDYCMFRMIATSTAFTGGGTVTIGYTGGAAVVNTFASTIITTGTPGQVDTVLVTGASNITTTQNVGIQITNASAPFAAGTGTANVFIWYSIV